MSVPRLILYASGFAFLATIGVFATKSSPPRMVERPREVRLASPGEYGLVIATGQLDFGKVWEDQKLEWPVVIENQSTKTAHVQSLVASCGCLTPIPSSMTIEAGAKSKVTLRLDLTPNPILEPLAELRPFHTSFHAVISTESGNSIELAPWEVSGRIQKALRASQWYIDLGKYSVKAQPIPPSKCIRITKLVPMRGLTAKCKSARFEVKLAASKDNPSDSELTLIANVNLPVGRHSFEIQLEAELESGEKVRPREIVVQGEIAADIQPSPPNINLGARPVGASIDESVTLYSLTKRGFRVVGYRGEMKGLSIDPLSADADRGQPKFRMSQRILATGRQMGRAVIIVEDAETGMTEIPVAVEYHGVDPG